MTTAIGFDAIVGQQHPIRLLKTFVRNQTLPHALLFAGDNGVGKQTMAIAFAMACNCQTLKATRSDRPPLEAINACGHCVPCKKIAGALHPDVIHVTPTGTVIRIARIRELLATLALKPNEANFRVVILAQSHAMNAEAANALLKVLEEPPDRTLLILTATQPADLLPTVVSRCRQIRFAPLSSEAIAGLLCNRGNLDAKAAATVAALSGGSYTRALAWTNPRWLARRAWILHVLETLTAGGSKGALRPWLALSERLAKNKDRVEESLEIITMWLRDVMVAGVDPQRIVNQDRQAAIVQTAGQMAPKVLLAQMDAVDQARRALAANTNTRLTLDAMVLRLAQANGAIA